MGFSSFFVSFLFLFFIWVQRMACLCAFAFISSESMSGVKEREEKKLKQFSLLLLLDIIVVFFYYIEADTTQQRQLRGKYFCKVHFLRQRSKTRLIYLLLPQPTSSGEKQIFWDRLDSNRKKCVVRYNIDSRKSAEIFFCFFKHIWN